MFNTKVETYIAKLIDDFNTSIYILVTLLIINIVSGEAKLFNFSERIIMYIINIEGKIYTLNLNKV